MSDSSHPGNAPEPDPADPSERVQRALRLIENAQSLIGAAGQMLCSCNGFDEEYTLTWRLYEQVKNHWHRVNGRRLSGSHVIGGEPAVAGKAGQS